MAEPSSAAPASSPRAARVVTWTPEQFAGNVYELMVIYARAMGYPPSAAGYRADTARRHIANAGFDVRVAVDPNGRPLGFGYGYTTQPGQWWHDLVHRAVRADLRAEWMVDAFELSEMHVVPEAQGHGIGRELLLDLCRTLPQRSILLSTPDANTRAFRLYRSVGFVDLARSYLFPGDSRPFAVLGARLPLVDDV
ncbi:acetyltransferase (GNAT) family protein [Jatrophihabitans sp. GAS493]|uniref:GNAT family N-acetyltransferase n=1 Tax=Jatrophihabitans sp. GAS493 TaxID=1907575 RepID=UPI000BB9A6EB|nr:GNAT family N-acetyltransferase [Jatrophihabitans sp. GAS493]SOD74350.1 acetyltransferase (GNAT) family protein [Jatrophihabitans sp. GAS493]